MRPSSAGRLVLVLSLAVLLGPARPRSQAAREPGLLFYLSGDRGLTADFAANGRAEPNFASDVRVIDDGAKGRALQCGHSQLLSYWAAGNIFAARGTLSFFWRSREPVGPTPFPVFRVGYADHSSWDMVWLRIDYNARPGFDAFVTDANLARTRVSYAIPAFPTPNAWTHLALSWDETQGIRFYVNGQFVAQKAGAAVFDAALDQFGPHSRIISPMQVQSAYNFVRGGDLDELRIYDRMLSDENVATLSKGDAPTSIPPLDRTLDTSRWRDEWWFRYGWNRPGDVPVPLPAGASRIRKVEILDAYDLKRWWWKGTDGIRETTWPGVYNRSRLPGRNDYFQLPDWDCYSLSGDSVTFFMPDEPWNHLEVSGAAFGSLSIVDRQLPGEAVGSLARGTLVAERPKGQERTFHHLAEPVRGRAVRFNNVEQETPIGELGAYLVDGGREPAGIGRLTYRLSSRVRPDQPSLQAALGFIEGRFAPDERATLVAVPAGAPVTTRRPPAPGLPIVHVLVPADFRDGADGARRSSYAYGWTNLPGGLDGIAIDLPALDVKPTHGEWLPLNIQVKDPSWPLRAMIDVSVSIRPGEPHTIWLDTRDRILPVGRGLYLTIAAAGGGFGAAALDGAELRLVFKARAAALVEHTADRLTQVRDNFAQIVEEHPNSRRLSLYTQFETDVSDLLRVDPDNVLGRQYWYDYNKEQPRPPVALKPIPAGTPAWAFRQVEHLGLLKRFVNWYIDRRQISNGEFGGGLSDDGDLTNWWPGTALMGVDPAKVLNSLRRELDAFYAEGMFTNGLSTIQADELHSYEEGIQALGQALTLDYASPRQLERAMETALATERITGINTTGHRHIRSSYFSGTTIAEEGVWGWQKPSSLLILHPAMALVDYNGSPRVKKWLLEMADGLLAHRKREADGRYGVRTTIEFATDNDPVAGPATGGGSERIYPLLWAAYRWTGDRKYLQPFLDAGVRSLPSINADALSAGTFGEEWRAQVLPALEGTGGRAADPAFRFFAWQQGGDLRHLESLFTDQAEAAALREYINTEGSLWIDRVNVDHGELQRARLGGVALERNAISPGHAVGWDFARPGDEERVAILVREATPTRLRIAAYNLGDGPIAARMTAWGVDPGTWKVTRGTRAEVKGGPLADSRTDQVTLERSRGLDVAFAPRTVTVLELDLVAKGTPYWSRPDLGIAAEDVRTAGRTMTVTVHSLGAVDAPAARLALRDSTGREVAHAAVPALRAPLDLNPSTARVTLAMPARWLGGSLHLDVRGRLPEITTLNNDVAVK
jgi:hypothetical protein